MSDDNKDTGSPHHNRRSSYAGQTLAELFGANKNRTSFGVDQNSAGNGVSPFPGSVASAAAQAHRRRMSIGGLGLTGTSPSSGAAGMRSESVSSSNSGTIDEVAVEEGGTLPPLGATSPFARRVSFGAKAFRDVRSASISGGGVGGGGGGGGTNGRSSISDSVLPSASAADTAKKTNPPTPKGRESGYNWADNFRNRAERSASIASSSPTSASPSFAQSRAKSIAASQPAAAPPKEVKAQNVPDHFQERILKGDFYMD